MRSILVVLSILVAGLANAQEIFSFRLIPTTGGSEGFGAISFATVPADGLYGFGWQHGAPSRPDPYDTFVSVSFDPSFTTDSLNADQIGLTVHVADQSIIWFSFGANLGSRFGQVTNNFYFWQVNGVQQSAGYAVTNWPLPEPETYALFAVGLALVAWRGRWLKPSWLQASAARRRSVVGAGGELSRGLVANRPSSTDGVGKAQQA